MLPKLLATDPRFLKAREAATQALASQSGTTQDISADVALKTALDAYADQCVRALVSQVGIRRRS
ncbi:hypothetical protein QMZ92_32845 [Streptomyces sp. HNM0645]|uniref:hypothetical protein n=1 Tax=Streptomyces sp. HNM0645 TaxID=2782343 RepID=UPI0024B6F4F1|nr:hypothetical protein [Streptomyces sp. HNM0645]MDI9889006.1 hypothetical protein [Streptomyces sp. HNM0645]